MGGSARVPGQAWGHRREAAFDGGPARDASPSPADDASAPVVGVLALQGDVLEHLRMLRDVGARAVPVKTPGELERVDALLLPGGESTTIGWLLARFGLVEPLRQRLAEGLPTFGTCAGAILLARAATLHDGTPTQQPLLGGLDVSVRRNAFGRQVASFEAPLEVTGPGGQPLAGGPLTAVFIRAPWFEELGAGVQAMAAVPTEDGDKIVIVRQGPILASAFHPELTGDRRLHAAFVELVRRG